MLQKILSLIDEANIAEAFAEIDRMDIKSPSISQLKREFILGDKRFDFYDRLKMAVKNEVKETFSQEKLEPTTKLDTSDIKIEFWKQFLVEAKKRSDLFENKNPNPANTARDGWLDLSTGITSVGYNVRASSEYVRVCLYINKPQAASKAIFDTLYQYKAEIERSFGDTLVWERKDKIQHSRIDYTLDINVGNQENWAKINDFLISNVVKMVKVLTPYLEDIKRNPKDTNQEQYISNQVITKSINLHQLYQKLNNKLNDETLILFCMLHFDSVYNNFSQGQSKTLKITALLDYAKRNDLLEKLEHDLNNFLN